MNNIERAWRKNLSISKWHAAWGFMLLLLMICVSPASQGANEHHTFSSLPGKSGSHRLPFGYMAPAGSSGKMRFDVWKDEDPDAKSTLELAADSSVKASGYITVPEDGIYHWEVVNMADGQRMSGPFRLAVSSQAPVISVPFGAVDGGVFQMRVKPISAVDIADVQLRICQAKTRCGSWISNLKNEDGGNYSAVIPVDHLAGSFAVDIWVMNEVGHKVSGVMNYFRRVKADATLSVSLDQGVGGETDSPKKSRARRNKQIVYRITLSNDQYILDDASLRYRLPGGLRPDGLPTLVTGEGLPGLNPQWDGDADDELLAPGSVLQEKSSMVIDVPVILKDAAEDSASVKSIVYAGAGNLVGTVDAMHRFQVADRAVPTGERVRTVKSLDAETNVQPGQIIKYTIRVSNRTFKTVRNLLIRDRAPDHTTLVGASCGKLPASACSTLTLGDKDVVDGGMTHAALCTGGGPRSDPQGKHVFWCLNGDLEPLADYTVNYAVQINGAAPAAPLHTSTPTP